MRMRGSSGKNDHWVLRETRDIESETECVYLFIFFFRGRQTNDK